MREDNLIDQVRESLPEVRQYRDLVKGNPDLMLAVARIEQVEDLLEAVARMHAADGDQEKAAAEAKLKGARLHLLGPIFVDSKTLREKKAPNS